MYSNYMCVMPFETIPQFSDVFFLYFLFFSPYLLVWQVGIDTSSSSLASLSHGLSTKESIRYFLFLLQCFSFPEFLLRLFFFLTVSILNSLSGNSRICIISESVCKACFVFLGRPFLPCLVICSQLSVCTQNMNQHRQSCVPVPCARAGRSWFGLVAAELWLTKDSSSSSVLAIVPLCLWASHDLCLILLPTALRPIVCSEMGFSENPVEFLNHKHVPSGQDCSSPDLYSPIGLYSAFSNMGRPHGVLPSASLSSVWSAMLVCLPGLGGGGLLYC